MASSRETTEPKNIDLSRSCSCEAYPRPIVCYACAIRSLLLLGLVLSTEAEQQGLLFLLLPIRGRKVESAQAAEGRANDEQSLS